MLLRIDPASRAATRVPGEQLKAFGLDERALQDIFFHSLDRLLPDEELPLISQSRRWQEEPDLLAMDERGRLYIFELKIWESQSENLLQALRYGQLFGPYDYAGLDQLFRRFDETGRSLAHAHEATFGATLKEEEFNREQVFVIITNGLDFRTRQAVRYWRSCGLEMRPWVYRVYKTSQDELLLEMARFAVEDNPYEDVSTGCFILNTNFSNDPTDHEDMLAHQKAAAYHAPWKFKVQQLSKGDLVFLYQSGVGIVAMGIASGALQKGPYHNDPLAD
ncbi:MAG: hypothetical protein ABSF98_21320 [Bryobacteraceae bacterium]|jgi:hypothetical protein